MPLRMACASFNNFIHKRRFIKYIVLSPHLRSTKTGQAFFNGDPVIHSGTQRGFTYADRSQHFSPFPFLSHFLPRLPLPLQIKKLLMLTVNLEFQGIRLTSVNSHKRYIEINFITFSRIVLCFYPYNVLC